MITAFGDLVMPRGGALGMASLLGIFAGLEVGTGVVRTAVSRLAADGWLCSARAGRNSTYRLTAKALESYASAALRVYGPPPVWDGQLRILLPDTGAAFSADGHGPLAPGVWIALGTQPVPDGVPNIAGHVTPAHARLLAIRAWPTDATAPAYERFLQAFLPVQDWLDGGRPLSDRDALTLRLLLVHEYRRAILRDPALPKELRPEPWAGTQARLLCGAVYRALLPGSERWLDQHGQASDAALPAAKGLNERF